MLKWLQDHAPESIVTAIATVIGWLSLRLIGRVDKHEARLAALEQNRVTHADIGELRETVIEGQQRNDDKLERIWQQISALSRHDR